MKNKYRTVSWKRNLRKVPEMVRRKLVALGKSDPIEVGVAVRLTAEQIASGAFGHLRVSLQPDGTASVPAAIMPPASMGRWSTINRSGLEIIRKDLPMVSKAYEFDTPNWGDWSKGSHTVGWRRDVYQREQLPPKHLALKLEISRQLNSPYFVLRVVVEEVLSPRDRHFKDDLLAALNLLQENAGHVDIHRAHATIEEYLRTTHVAWELLPPGERERAMNFLIRIAGEDAQQRARLLERFSFLERLTPVSWVLGENGFRRYFGALFADDLVVLDNTEYGNAAYVMFDNWKDLSRLSRTELLAKAHRDFIRVRHEGGWKRRIRWIVERHRPRAA